MTYHVTQAAERDQLLTEAARLEASTATVRALNDAMALVGEQLLGGQTHRPEPFEQGPPPVSER